LRRTGSTVRPLALLLKAVERSQSASRHLDQRATFKLGVLSIRIASVPPAVLFQSCLERQIGVLLDWHRVMHEIEYLVKGFLRVVLESNVMPCILGDQLSKSRELAPKNSFRACSVACLR
jgi:hypothetical protein